MENNHPNSEDFEIVKKPNPLALCRRAPLQMSRPGVRPSVHTIVQPSAASQVYGYYLHIETENKTLISCSTPGTTSLRLRG